MDPAKPIEEPGFDSMPCGMFPPVPIDDLTLVRLYRREAGDDEVSEAIAQLGADVAIKSMKLRHHAHNVAVNLRPVDLHQRAELLELLYSELGIPEPSPDSPAIETDADRGRYFRAVVLRLLDREVQARLDETAFDEAAEADAEAQLWMEQNPDDPNSWEP